MRAWISTQGQRVRPGGCRWQRGVRVWLQKQCRGPEYCIVWTTRKRLKAGRPRIAFQSMSRPVEAGGGLLPGCGTGCLALQESLSLGPGSHGGGRVLLLPTASRSCCRRLVPAPAQRLWVAARGSRSACSTAAVQLRCPEQLQLCALAPGSRAQGPCCPPADPAARAGGAPWLACCIAGVWLPKGPRAGRATWLSRAVLQRRQQPGEGVRCAPAPPQLAWPVAPQGRRGAPAASRPCAAPALQGHAAVPDLRLLLLRPEVGRRQRRRRSGRAVERDTGLSARVELHQECGAAAHPCCRRLGVVDNDSALALGGLVVGDGHEGVHLLLQWQQQRVRWGSQGARSAAAGQARHGTGAAALPARACSGRGAMAARRSSGWGRGRGLAGRRSTLARMWAHVRARAGHLRQPACVLTRPPWHPRRRSSSWRSRCARGRARS
jgi:hypothetical protein